jgi:hypothetical protein
MHSTVRLAIASIISSIVGYLLILVGNGLYAAATGGHKPPTSSDFTIINWTVSLIISGITFIYAYIKTTDWLGE